MELTPIKVRGKKRAPGENILAWPKQKRVRGRGQAKDRRPRASDLERSLPLEVLERILWMSENVNFARASLRLGRLLSGRSTLRDTFLAAFGPTWDVWFGCVRGQGAGFPVVHSYAGWETDTEHFGGNPAFQTDVLACQWATIDMILDCRDTWVRRYAQNRPHEHYHLWGAPTAPSPHAGSGVTIGMSGIKEARYYFYHDYEAFRTIEKMNSYRLLTDYLLERDKSWVEIHESAEIPDDLLTGPWDEKDLQKFFWLVQAGARLSPGQTWEITREGYRQAVRNPLVPNLTVIRLLRCLGAFRRWPDHVKEDEIQWINRNIKPMVKNAGHAWKDNFRLMSGSRREDNPCVKYHYILQTFAGQE